MKKPKGFRAFLTIVLFLACIVVVQQAVFTKKLETVVQEVETSASEVSDALREDATGILLDRTVDGLTPMPHDDDANAEAIKQVWKEVEDYAQGRVNVPAVDKENDHQLGWFQFFDENGRGLTEGCGGFADTRDGTKFTLATSRMAFDMMCDGVRKDHLLVRSESPSLRHKVYKVEGVQSVRDWMSLRVEMPEIADSVFIVPGKTL